VHGADRVRSAPDAPAICSATSSPMIFCSSRTITGYGCGPAALPMQ